MKTPRRKSALHEFLIALVPYSRANIALSFKPNTFFNDLSKSSAHNQPALRSAYNRARKRGLVIEADGKLSLSKQGLREVQPFIAQRLKRGSFLMVIFDIPEEASTTRARFRRMLKHWDFKLLQKSVWSSDMDYTDALLEVIEDEELSEFVKVYESAEIYK